MEYILKRIAHMNDVVNRGLKDRYYKVNIKGDISNVELYDENSQRLRECHDFCSHLETISFLHGIIEYQFYISVKNIDK